MVPAAAAGAVEEEARQPVAAQALERVAPAGQPPPLLGSPLCPGHAAHRTPAPARSKPPRQSPTSATSCLLISLSHWQLFLAYRCQARRVFAWLM